MLKIYLIIESFRFAISALRQNLLRTVLSLLGVTIGIFAIISVYTVVDSLEKNLKQSLSFLGSDVIYVEKWPWVFDNPDYPWWKYWNRPTSNFDEFNFLKKKITQAESMAIFRTSSSITLKNQNNSLEGSVVQGVTYEFNKVSNVEIGNGRYFTEQEIEADKNVVIVGHDVAEKLFGYDGALGKEMSIKGQKFKIIGIIKKVGSSALNMGKSADFNCIIPIKSFNKIFANSKWGPEGRLAFKGKDDDEDLVNLEGELRMLIRQYRSLKPKDEDNFSINRPEMITGMVSKIFDSISVAATVIGLFSILVGGFGIANIMFVSVKERTNVIGIQKSLGAKNSFILYQFLFESIMLSLIGGLVGLLLVLLVTYIPQDVLDLEISMSNAVKGLSISIVIGLLSGIIPAFVASKLDPVIAIRSK